MSKKQEVLNDERRFQRACDKYIDHEGIIYCVSTLIYELREVAEKLEDYDTYMTLTGGVPDYEAPARYFIEFDADLYQLEEIAEQCDSWSNVFEHACAKHEPLLKPYEISYQDAYGDDDEEILWHESSEIARECFLRENPDVRIKVVIEQVLDTDDYCEHNDGLEACIRTAVQDAINSADDDETNQWVCNEYDLEPEYHEVYEHWLVSRYLGKELQEQGEVVEEYMGLNIWGRTTTGQAIRIDGVIRQIVSSRDEDHWVWGEV